MDARVLILLALEALFALWLLYRSKLLNTTPRLLVSLLLLAAAFVLRARCLDYQTLDYRDFLSRWVAFYRENGGFHSFSYPLGNYNVPYMYFLCLFSYLPISDLYLIKLLSIFFDVVLAYGSMRLLRSVKQEENVLLACFFVILFLPTVILNGALWGQCDSIYVALAVLAVACAMEDRPIRSILFFTLSFAFKLQAVFLLPILAVFWFKKRMKLWHFLLFPVFYVIIVLPAVALGKPFLETLTLYTSQTGSIGDGLNYNSPSIYAFFWNASNPETASALGIVGAFTYLAALLLFAFFRRDRLSNRGILTLLLLMAVGIPFLLPHMHDRYFFAADVVSVIFAFACPLFFLAAPLTQFASLLGYHAYLKMRYLLYMNHGARALLVVLVLGLIRLLGETQTPLSDKTQKSEIQP